LTKILIFFVFLCFIIKAQTYNWEVLPNSHEAARHDDINFLNPNLGWAVNSQGEILKTTDGGNSWELKFNTLSYLRSVKFTDSLHGFAGTINTSEGTKPILYKTTDGGETWDSVANIPSPKPQGICGLSVVGDVIYGSGDFYGPAVVIKSTDNGSTWNSINMSKYATTLIDCYFFSPDSGFVVGGSPNSIFNTQNGTIKVAVLFTPDGGKTWQTKYSGTIAPEWGWKIVFPTKKIGYVSMENFNSASILKTTNGGESWTKLNIPNLVDLEGIGFINEMTGWVAGRVNEAFTNDGGSTWITKNIDIGKGLNRFQFFGDTLGYASGTRIYKYSKQNMVSVQNANDEMPKSFLLSQNYPNPFNPSTTIRYVLTEASNVLIRIYDGLGKELLTLLNSYQTSGEHSIKWDGKDGSGNIVSSGLYIYRIDAGKNSESKMMMFLK
jgi:photosystem II stability/assembly factor-like uncharacterized protein